MVDLVFTAKSDVSVDAINNALIEASNGSLKGVLGCTSDPVVSVDLVGNAASSTVDLGLTLTMGTHTAKVITWYDNEWGFSNRMLDLTKKLVSLDA